jgi:hypothetical protein
MENQRTLIESGELDERVMYVFMGCLERDVQAHTFSDEHGVLFDVNLSEMNDEFNSCVESIISQSCHIYLTALYERRGAVNSIWRIEPREGEYRLCQADLPSR